MLIISRFFVGSCTTEAFSSCTGLLSLYPKENLDFDMASDSASTEAIFDNFCCMVVEEFLIRKNLSATLDTMRAEWKRPSEVASINFSTHDNK